MEQLSAFLKEQGCEFLLDEPMSRHTTMKVGGPADILIEPQGQEQLEAVLRYLQGRAYPVLVIGNGSNLLVSDDGIRGAVVSIGSGLSDIRSLGNGLIYAGAGASLSKLCRFAQEQGLTGLEFAYGIPGSCGGAAYMNAGAYGGEMKDVLTKCDHLAMDGEAACLEGGALELGYRHSAYHDMDAVITGLYVQLAKGDPEEISAKMANLMQRRKSKQPLEYPSAGSAFKRPEGHYAAALIERCGLKGKTVGGAQVSEKHAGFFINRGNATCRDFLELADCVKRTVREQAGVALEMEIRVLK